MFMAGPYCTRYLADLGADVIKVEPMEGDNLRHSTPQRDGCSSYFGHINVGKCSVVIDLKSEQGLQHAHRLAREVDVIVENGRPGTIQRFGLDHACLRANDPALIYCSISGYGQEGPGAHRPAFAQTMHAASGLDLAFAGYQDGEQQQPPNTGIFTAAILAGLHAFSGVLTALYDRERTGQRLQRMDGRTVRRRGSHHSTLILTCKCGRVAALPEVMFVRRSGGRRVSRRRSDS